MEQVACVMYCIVLVLPSSETKTEERDQFLSAAKELLVIFVRASLLTSSPPSNKRVVTSVCTPSTSADGPPCSQTAKRGAEHDVPRAKQGWKLKGHRLLHLGSAVGREGGGSAFSSSGFNGLKTRSTILSKTESERGSGSLTGRPRREVVTPTLRYPRPEIR